MYLIKFNDNTSFTGGTIEDSLWDKIPITQQIKELHFLLGNQKLVLQGYERYNFLIVRASIYGHGSKILGIYVMGERKDSVERFFLNLQKRKMEHSFVKFGQEFRGGMSTGWKQGLQNQEPSYKIL
jgi:hypothetical protein